MDSKKLDIARNRKGFIAALDQSGGSTPKALRLYGIDEDKYSSEDEMFKLVHEMRTRIIKAPSFNKDHILGAILFEQTIDREIDGMKTADYLWNKLEILPFVKVDQGLADLENGVQLMKEMTKLDSLLERAKERGIFGTKMRSVIKELNEEGIKKVVNQQFDYAKRIIKKGFVPIIEPEVDIHAENKAEIEKVLFKELKENIEKLAKDDFIMLKLTLPEEDNLYLPLYDYDNVLRIVALSGGYTREESNERLGRNHKVIASFSRALTEGAKASMTDEEFNKHMEQSINSIYKESIK